MIRCSSRPSHILASFVRTYSAKSNLLSYDDLPTFFEYIRSTGGGTNNTLFNGTLYELHTKSFLQKHLNIHNLKHIGGSYDNGIDLRGKWDLRAWVEEGSEASIDESTPRETTPSGREIVPIFSSGKLLDDIDVLVQCKSYKTKISAAVVRELSGIYHYNVPFAKRESTFLFLIAPLPLTKQGMAQFDGTDVPMIFLQIEKLLLRGPNFHDLSQYAKGKLQGFYVNRCAESMLKGVDIDRKLVKVRMSD